MADRHIANHLHAAEVESYVEKLQSGCWLWVGPTHASGKTSKNTGATIRVPKLKIGGEWFMGRRALWEACVGTLPKEVRLVRNRSICDNPDCVSPHHTIVGFPSEQGETPRGGLKQELRKVQEKATDLENRVLRLEKALSDRGLEYTKSKVGLAWL